MKKVIKSIAIVLVVIIIVSCLVVLGGRLWHFWRPISEPEMFLSTSSIEKVEYVDDYAIVEYSLDFRNTDKETLSDVHIVATFNDKSYSSVETINFDTYALFENEKITFKIPKNDYDSSVGFPKFSIAFGEEKIDFINQEVSIFKP